MNSFFELKTLILGRPSFRGVVKSRSPTDYLVFTDQGVQRFTSPIVFKPGDEVSIFKNGSLQPADDGLVFYV